MTAEQTYKKFEKLFKKFNDELIDLNTESKHFLHGEIELKIVDPSFSNKYHPEASRHFFKMIPTIEDVGGFLDTMFPEERKNDE